MGGEEEEHVTQGVLPFVEPATTGLWMPVVCVHGVSGFVGDRWNRAMDGLFVGLWRGHAATDAGHVAYGPGRPTRALVLVVGACGTGAIGDLARVARVGAGPSLGISGIAESGGRPSLGWVNSVYQLFELAIQMQIFKPLLLGRVCPYFIKNGLRMSLFIHR